MKKKTRQQIILIVIAAIIAIIIVFPIYFLVISSFKPLGDIFNMDILPDLSTLSLDNYRTVFQEESFGGYIYNSFFVATIVTVAALIFHAMSAYALARLNFMGKNVIFTWILSTLMIPFSVIMIPLFIIVQKMHLINNLWGGNNSHDPQCLWHLPVPTVLPGDSKGAGGGGKNRWSILLWSFLACDSSSVKAHSSNPGNIILSGKLE